jgi:anti-sigma factor ChrR (cupin superfamily)
VERKILWERGDASSCMVRLAPGASFPTHGHPIDEESVILEGSLWIGSLLLKAGDFHVGLSGVEHDEVRTDEGCVCFLRTATSFFQGG